MNPSDQQKHLDSINWLLEGAADLVDIQLPKGAQTSRGQPSGAPKKLQKTKPCDPSQFEYFQPPKKAKVQEEKKTRIQPSQSSSRKQIPVRSTQRILLPPEAPQFLKDIPSMAQDYVEKIFDVKADGHCGFKMLACSLGRGQERTGNKLQCQRP